MSRRRAAAVAGVLVAAAVGVAVLPGADDKPAVPTVGTTALGVVSVDKAAGVAIWGAGDRDDAGVHVGKAFSRCYVAGAVRVVREQPGTPAWRRDQWGALALDLAPLPAPDADACACSPFYRGDLACED